MPGPPPVIFFVGLHLSKLRGNNLFYFALYINHNSFSPHKHRFEKLRQARHKIRTLLFSSAIIGSSLVLVETFKPKSLPSRHCPALPFRPNLKLTFAFNRNCAWLYF
jgi:hypothetical protein